MSTAELTRARPEQAAKCAACPHKDTWVNCICTNGTTNREDPPMKGTIMSYGGDDAFDGRHGDDRTPPVSGGQQPGTPDPQPGPTGNDAADQRH